VQSTATAGANSPVHLNGDTGGALVRGGRQGRPFFVAREPVGAAFSLGTRWLRAGS